MAKHYESSVGETSEWYTPPEIFAALKLEFDLDPCSPGPGHWVPAKKIYTKADDGLAQPWSGLVFMNPPWAGRHKQVPWLKRFFLHANGVGIARAYTSSDWWHEHMPRAQMILFPEGKTQFVRPDGSIGKEPSHAVVLIGMGAVACEALLACGLGMVWDRRPLIKDQPATSPAPPAPAEDVDLFPRKPIGKGDSLLTEGYASGLAQQIRATRPGQAHWAGSGPFGATCGDCTHLGYWKRRHNASGDLVNSTRSNGCAKFFQLTGGHGPAVPKNTSACRHFERRGGCSD
jgi:hypothetical protein